MNYRLPREPSTPRSAVWRGLRRLGMAQIADGLVALPADARSREQLEWVAQQVHAAHGSAGVWLAKAAAVTQERELAAAMAAARAQEYAAVRDGASAAGGLSAGERQRVVRRLRAELRRIRRRDYFPPVERDLAVAAVAALVPTETGEAPLDARGDVDLTAGRPL